MTEKVRRLVLDTLKPLDPSIVEFATRISALEGITAVNISIVEIDRKVENAKITIEGDDINLKIVADLISDLQVFFFMDSIIGIMVQVA